MTITELRPGTHLLGFRVERMLGRGGMGVVYLAHQLALDRMVALKLLAPELAEDEAYRERFLRESKLAASLDHPSIVPVHDAGEVDGRLYIAMRYVEGSDLGQLLDAEGPLAPARVIALLAPVADALDTAHEAGLVHRDVKPSNVLLDRRERAYLADFGLTKQVSEQGLVEQSHFAASLDYVAPEQIEGAPLDGRADQYSLGCVLYECLTGEPPFRRGSLLATLWAHVNNPPPETDTAIDPVIAKSLAKESEDRYGSCRELVAAAGEALGLAVPRRDRRALLLAAAGAAILAGALAAGLALALGGGEQPKPSLAVTERTVVRIDPKTNEIAAAIDVGPGPKVVAVGGRTVWVYNVQEGTVSAIDSETNEIQRVSRISTAPRVGAFYDGPVLAADDTGAWLVGSTRAGLVSKGVLTRVSLNDTYKPEYTLDYDPLAVAVGEGAVWVVALSDRGGVVLRISPTTGAVLREVSIPGGRPGFIGGVDGIAVGEEAVWVMDSGQALLYRIDPASFKVTGRVDLGELSAEPVAGGGFVWALTTPRDTQAGIPLTADLVRVHPGTLRVSRVVPPTDIFDVALDEDSVWLNSFGAATVSRVDPRTGTIASTIRVTPERPESRNGIVTRSVLVPSGTIAAGAGGVWVTVSS